MNVCQCTSPESTLLSVRALVGDGHVLPAPISDPNVLAYLLDELDLFEMF